MPLSREFIEFFDILYTILSFYSSAFYILEKVTTLSLLCVYSIVWAAMNTNAGYPGGEIIKSFARVAIPRGRRTIGLK